MYIAGAVRGMERGTLSEQRNPDGSERLAEMELLRLAMPRRVFTLSQVKYAIDRITWLYENRALVGGLRFIEEPPVLRFFMGRLEPFRTGRQNSRPSSAPIWVTACRRTVSENGGWRRASAAQRFAAGDRPQRTGHESQSFAPAGQTGS